MSLFLWFVLYISSFYHLNKKMDQIPWKRDLLHTGLVGIISATIFGVATGARRYTEYQDRKNPPGPSDLVTVVGFNSEFHNLKRFTKSKDEKSFLKTIRHHLNRALYLFESETQRLTGWDRNVAIRLRASEVIKLSDILQYLIKQRLGEQPILGFDESLGIIKGAAQDLLHNLDAVGHSSLE